ncbi:hypothetical protein V6N13_025668 [Hibiscus sabdariffa]
MFSCFSPEERLIASQCLAKKSRGHPRKTQPVPRRFANAYLSDSDFEHKKVVILCEARETLQLGKLLGATTIGNEEGLGSVAKRRAVRGVVCQQKRGKSFGGILVVWERDSYIMEESCIRGWFVWLVGQWVQEACLCGMLGLYAPCNVEGQVAL